LRNLVSSLSSAAQTKAEADFQQRMVVSVKKMNWFDNEPFTDDYDIAIGSALVYSPDHIVLADNIKTMLAGRLREVLIVQIKDRPGFQRFLCRLETLGVQVSIKEVEEDIYDFASNYIHAKRDRNGKVLTMPASLGSVAAADIKKSQQEPTIFPLRTPREDFCVLTCTSDN
jgi:hypothetical protein